MKEKNHSNRNDGTKRKKGPEHAKGQSKAVQCSEEQKWTTGYG